MSLWPRHNCLPKEKKKPSSSPPPFLPSPKRKQAQRRQNRKRGPASHFFHSTLVLDKISYDSSPGGSLPRGDTRNLTQKLDHVTDNKAASHRLVTDAVTTLHRSTHDPIAGKASQVIGSMNVTRAGKDGVKANRLGCSRGVSLRLSLSLSLSLSILYASTNRQTDALSTWEKNMDTNAISIQMIVKSNREQKKPIPETPPTPSGFIDPQKMHADVASRKPRSNVSLFRRPRHISALGAIVANSLASCDYGGLERV